MDVRPPRCRLLFAAALTLTHQSATTIADRQEACSRRCVEPSRLSRRQSRDVCFAECFGSTWEWRRHPELVGHEIIAPDDVGQLIQDSQDCGQGEVYSLAEASAPNASSLDTVRDEPVNPQIGLHLASVACREILRNQSRISFHEPENLGETCLCLVPVGKVWSTVQLFRNAGIGDGNGQRITELDLQEKDRKVVG